MRPEGRSIGAPHRKHLGELRHSVSRRPEILDFCTQVYRCSACLTAEHKRRSMPLGSCRMRHPSEITCRVPESSGLTLAHETEAKPISTSTPFGSSHIRRDQSAHQPPSSPFGG